MSLNITRIKQQVKKAISIKPTNINLRRVDKTDDGMNGYIENEITVATFDGFIDESKNSILIEKASDSGTTKKTRQITLLAVCEGFEIKDDDYFDSNSKKYKVTYASKIVPDVYNCDLEVIE